MVECRGKRPAGRAGKAPHGYRYSAQGWGPGVGAVPCVPRRTSVQPSPITAHARGSCVNQERSSPQGLHVHHSVNMAL